MDRKSAAMKTMPTPELRPEYDAYSGLMKTMPKMSARNTDMTKRVSV